MLVYQRVENQPLVGGFNMFQPPEKYEFVRLDWIIPTIGEN